MRITLNDTRPLAAVLVDPANGACYNRASGAWEPFDAAKHMTPLAAVAGLPAAFSTVKTIAGMDVLLSRPDAVAVIVTLDSGGNPLNAVDCFPSPAPFAYPTFGGFSR